MKHKRMGPPKDCEWCGLPFVPWQSQGAHARFCSRSCASKAAPPRRGLRNGNWAGDRVGWDGAHIRARKVLPQMCSNCGTTENLEVALKKEVPVAFLRGSTNGARQMFSVRTEDYFRLCVRCHREYDGWRDKVREPTSEERRAGWAKRTSN